MRGERFIESWVRMLTMCRKKRTRRGLKMSVAAGVFGCGSMHVSLTHPHFLWGTGIVFLIAILFL